MKHMVQKWNNNELEIILQLLKSSKHIRAIAKEINEPHVTILRRLNELVNKNVLDFRREGKNKIFFLRDNIITKSYIYRAEHYKLEKLVNKSPEMMIIIEEILKKTKAELILLFGSYAKFKAKKDSDIDVYIETGNRKVKKAISEINSNLSIKIGPFNLKSLLIKEMIDNHVIIRGVERFYSKKENLY